MVTRGGEPVPDELTAALAEVAKAVAASIDRNGRIRYARWTDGGS